MSGSTSYLVAQQNLVVEGVDDFWILTELSRLFQRSGKPGISDDIFITPAGGASEAVYITTFMVGQKLQVATLLDSDGSGNDAKDKLVKKWLTRYQDNHAKVLSLGECVGVTDREFSIEDLFTEDWYLAKVWEVYQKQLTAAGCDKLNVSGSGQLVKRVEAAFEGYGVRFNKGSVAKIVRNSLCKMSKVDQLAAETIKMAERLIGTINSALPIEKEETLGHQEKSKRAESHGRAVAKAA